MMSVFPTISLFGIFLTLNFTLGSDLSITTTTSPITENSDVMLHCNYTGSETLNVVDWYFVVGTVGGLHDQNKGTILVSPCSSVGVSINTSYYGFTCNQNIVSWGLLNIQASNDGDVWRCAATTSSVIFSDPFTITIEAVSCTCGNIEENKTVYCERSTTHNVQWLYNNSLISGCYSGAATCLPPQWLGTNFTRTSTVKKISISNFKLKDCKMYSCKDVVTLEVVHFPYCPVLTMTKPDNDGPFDIVENTAKEFICKISSGSPAGAVQWYSDSGSPSDVDDDVEITHAITASSARSPTDNQEYITTSNLRLSPSRSYTGIRIYCKATNKPEQTPLTSHRKPLLNILYKAVVTSLYVLGFETNTEVITVYETHPLQFNCTVISNPLPTIQIRKGDYTLNSSTGIMTLLYSIGNARCVDAGTYACFGNNMFNEEDAIKQLQVYVYCSPRAADAVNLNRSSEINEALTFTFNAIAYPIPVFMWKKWAGGVWKNMHDGDNVRITSSGLQSNLTIHRVGYGDFGKYLLVVTNYIGLMELHYQLDPEGKPDTPTDFRYVQHLTTESSIQLEWKRGFDGGPSQTFFIKYKKISSSTWSYVSAIDAGEQTMHYMLTDLEIDTLYKLMIYSSNRKGNSSESELLIERTLGVTYGSSIWPWLGGAVGGVVGCAILVIIAIFVLRRYRFSTGIPNSGVETTTRNQYETNRSSDDVGYYNIGREVEVTNQSTSEESVPDYEILNQQRRDFTTYSSLQPGSSSLTNDKSSGENKTYENLQLRVN